MSLNTFGELLIRLAFALNLLAGFSFLRLAGGHLSYESLARRSYNVFVAVVTVAVALLYFLFFNHEFVFKYVFEYSDSSLPFFYLLSSFWGGQEGTYLLWLFFSALLGYVIIYRGGIYRNWAMVIYTCVNAFFLFIMTELSPFAVLDFWPPEGAGLNPLLQDPWMVIHPPVIFWGYALAAVPFSIALAALILNDYSEWVRRAFPWVGMTAFLLGAGNVMGGYWAYKTLGWGGYWAWDPVENSSFVPWFAALALLHGLIVEKRSGALRRSNILLSAIVFVLVVYGTFLTRSGVLADFSVHSFVDLGTTVYLVGFLILFLIVTLVLFAWRFRTSGGKPIEYNLFSRFFSLVAAEAMLFVFAMIVLFWSSLPVITTYLTNEPRAADIPTYNSFAMPFAVVYALLLAVSPLIGYGSRSMTNWPRKLIITLVVVAALGGGLFYVVLGAGFVFAVVFTLVLTGLVMYFLNEEFRSKAYPALGGFLGTAVLAMLLGVREYMYILLFATAAMAIVTNVSFVIKGFPRGWKYAGGQVAHFGFGLMIIGIVASSAFSTSEQLILPLGKSDSAYNLSVTYRGMANQIMHPNNELILDLNDGSGAEEIRPQLYYSERLNGIMRKPYIHRSFLDDLYFAPQEVREGEAGAGLVLVKGEMKRVGEYEITFDDFVMDQHSDGGGHMSVGARLEVVNGSAVDTVMPVLSMGSAGTSLQADKVVYLDTAGQYPVNITGIQADRGAVVLDIPGLTSDARGEQLALEISRKPLITLVWVGTTFILIGGLIAYFRRRSELEA